MIITFDCYGTLLDTSSIEQLISAMAREKSVDSNLAVTLFNSYEDRLMYGQTIIPYEKLIKKNLAFMDMELSSGSFFQDHYTSIINAYYSLKPFPEVLSVLHQLELAGHKLYLLSNSSKQIMRYNLKMLNNPFLQTFLPEQTHCYKPQLNFFKYVEQQIDIPSKEHIHIAKGFWWDIVPCTKLNWRKVWINRNHFNGLKEYMPYKEFSNLSNIPSYLKNYD